MTREFARLLPLLVAAIAVVGCAGLAEDVATHLVSRDVKTIDQEIAVFKADLALFRECLKERGGSCQGTTTTALPHSSQHAAAQPVAPVTPGSSRVLADSVAKLPAGHPAKDAHALLADPLVKQAAALHNHLRGHDDAGVPGVSIEIDTASGAKTSTLTLDVRIGQGEKLHHNLLASIGGTAWDSLHEHCRTVLREHQSDAELAADCRRATFIRGYFGAYFRQGEFVEVDVQLAGAIRAAGKDDPSLVATIDDVLEKADSALSNVFKVSNVGFVSRDATFTARLPTLEVTIDPTVEHLLTVEDVDTGQVLTRGSDFADLGVATDTSGVGTGDQIGAELLRVFLEAIYDAQEGLPAIYPVNAKALEPTGLTLGKYSLPTFKTPMGNVDVRDLTRMTDLNDRVATQTRVLVGRVIEGVGPFSLNNRALESFFVELVATSVRKAAEKATWCFYACDLNVDLDRLRADAEQAARDKIREEERKAEAAAKTAEEKAKAFARREAEQVRLRLRLSR